VQDFDQCEHDILAPRTGGDLHRERQTLRQFFGFRGDPLLTSNPARLPTASSFLTSETRATPAGKPSTL
jgi:hypothetical protein